MLIGIGAMDSVGFRITGKDDAHVGYGVIQMTIFFNKCSESRESDCFIKNIGLTINLRDYIQLSFTNAHAKGLG